MCCAEKGNSTVGQSWTNPPNIALAGVGPAQESRRPMRAPSVELAPWWVWLLVAAVVLVVAKK